MTGCTNIMLVHSEKHCVSQLMVQNCTTAFFFTLFPTQMKLKIMFSQDVYVLHFHTCSFVMTSTITHISISLIHRPSCKRSLVQDLSCMFSSVIALVYFPSSLLPCTPLEYTSKVWHFNIYNFLGRTDVPMLHIGAIHVCKCRDRKGLWRWSASELAREVVTEVKQSLYLRVSWHRWTCWSNRRCCPHSADSETSACCVKLMISDDPPLLACLPF